MNPAARYALESSALAQLPQELAQALRNAYHLDPSVNAFTSIVSPQEALSAYTGSSKGPLHGVPVAVKDLLCTRDLPTTAASRMLKNYTSPFDATVVRRLREAGAVVVGKTNMDEFGMGSANLDSHFGPTMNPAGPGKPLTREIRIAGGSSGGSAAAVAAGFCRIALASDTGGSTRLPAAYCGVVGFKPSYGMLSRWGMIAYASSLDCVGIMAKRIVDVHATFHLLSAFDEKDPTSASPQARRRAAAQGSPCSGSSLAGLRIGVPAEYFLEELSPAVLPPFRRALQTLHELGATLTSVSLPSTPLALGAYYVIASAEASSNLARYDGTRYGARAVADQPRSLHDGANNLLYGTTRSEGFGKEVQTRLLLGTHALSAEEFDNYFLQAQRVRRMIQLEFDAVFRSTNPLSSTTLSSTTLSSIQRDDAGKVDLIVHPSAIGTAPLASTYPGSPTAGYVQDVLNVPSSLAGLPAMSVPVGTSEDGWPIGVQLVGQWGSEELLFRVGELLEQ